MKAIYVHSTRLEPYAEWIVSGAKTLETRNRNTLKSLVGECVAIVRTSRNKATVIGYVWIDKATYCNGESFDRYRNRTLIPIGSKYDNKGNGKWFYHLSDAFRCEPYEVPQNAVKHGRVWLEW